MKIAAWLAWWLVMAVYGVVAVVADAMIDVCDGMEYAIDWLEEFADDRSLQ